MHRRLTHNTIIKLGSELVGRAAMFGLMILAARQLGEAGFGLYNYGLALGFVLAQLADMGLQLLVAREVAIHGSKAQPVVRRAFHLKLGLSGLVIALLSLIILQQPAALRFSLLLLGLLQLTHTYLEFVAYIYRGQQRLWPEAWLLGGVRLFTAVTGALILWQGGQLWQVAAGSLLIVAAFTAYGMGRLRQAGWLQQLSWPAMAQEIGTPTVAAYGRLLRQAAPLGLAIFLSIAYTRLAVLLLQRQMGETAVAHFSAAARLVEPAQLLPASLLAAVFPAFSLVVNQDRQQAWQLGAQVSLLLAAAGGAVALSLWWAADWLIPWLYGPAYRPAVPVLQLLSLAIVPAFVNYSLTHYLIAQNQQAAITLFMSLMLGLHLALSWFLIPTLGVTGPALSMIVAEGFLLAACLIWLRMAPVVDVAAVVKVKIHAGGRDK